MIFNKNLIFLFQQQNLLPYFDPTQIDGNSIMQMYNHLTNLPPPGVGTNAGTGGAAAGPPYSSEHLIHILKFYWFEIFSICTSS